MHLLAVRRLWSVVHAVREDGAGALFERAVLLAAPSAALRALHAENPTAAHHLRWNPLHRAICLNTAQSRGEDVGALLSQDPT